MKKFMEEYLSVKIHEKILNNIKDNKIDSNWWRAKNE